MSKLAVIAGTPVDTKMGVDYIEAKGGFEAVYLPAFKNPRECHIFQMFEQEGKERVMGALFEKAIDLGCEEFFIYCNSLSASFDYQILAKRFNKKVVTPLTAYELIAEKYDRIGLIAANCQATGGIEKVFSDINPDCYVYGLGILSLVEAIEAGIPSAEILKNFGISRIVDFFIQNKVQAMVLGCTHFPYLKEDLSKMLKEKDGGCELIDPADIMYDNL